MINYILHIFSGSYLRVLLYILISIYVVWVGVVVEPDTSSYVGLSLITPPGYGTFLFVFRKIFGEDIYYPIVVGVQLVIGFASCIYLIKTIKTFFELDKRWLFFLDVILLAPIVIPEFLTV